MTNTDTELNNTQVGNREPDDLLADVRRSILGSAILISVLVHLVLIGGTSFSLYRDWGEYGLYSAEEGFHTPSKINTIKNRLQREAADAERKAAAAKRAAEATAAAAASAPAADAGAAAQTDGTATNSDALKPPELEPLPPKTEFTYGDDLMLE